MDLEEIKELFADTFDIEESDVTDDTNKDSVASWDSLNHLRLVTALEQEFSVSFSMDEINSMTSFAAVVACVSNRLNA